MFDRTAEELLRVATYLTRDRHRAEDVVQATFLIAIEKAASYDRTRPVLPWLLAILANEARQLHRRERRALPPVAIATAASAPGAVADAAATAELARLCDQALEALPEPYRPVLILHLRHGLAGHEIAATLMVPDSTVRNQIARGLELLRRKLPAGIAGAVVLSAATGRGLAAVRREVLAHVPAAPAVLAAGTIVGAGITGGMFMLKHFVLAAALLALVGFGVWRSGWFGADPDANAVLPPTNAVAQVAVPSPPTPAPTAGLGEAQRQAVPGVGTDVASTSGSLSAVVAIEGTGTILADAACSLWCLGPDGRQRPVGEGRTATDGTIGFPALAPGAYRFVVDAAEHQEHVSIESGEATRLRCEIASGHRCTGTVVDRAGRPVAGAEVRRDGEWFSIGLARTAADGTFAIDHVRGSLQLWAVSGGRQPSKRLALDVKQDTVGVRLVLGATGERVVGRVVDERGEAAGGVRVYFGFDERIGSTTIAQFERHDVHADAAGHFAIDWARPGRVLVAAVANDGDLGRTSHRELLLIEGEPATVQLQFGDGAVVTGVVRDDAGRAVAGASLDVTSVDSGLTPLDRRFAVAAEDGTFVLRGLMAGKQWLGAQRANSSGLSVDSSVELQLRQQFCWNPVLGEGAPIVVRVVDHDDVPLAHRFLSIAVGGSIKNYGGTDADGRHRFEHLPSVEHQLKVYGADYGVVLAERTVVPGADELVIRLDASQVPSARLSGRIVDAKGQPVADAEVSMNANSGFVQPQRVDRDGRFRTDLLPPGHYGISAHARSRGLGYAIGSALLVAKQELDLGDLVLPATASLAVRLRGPDGEVVRAPMVRLGSALEMRSSSESIAPDEVDGVYRQAGINPGSYLLLLHGPDVAPQNLPITLAPGEQRELDVVAVRAVSVAFEIRCALVHPQGSGNLNVQFDVFDAAGERVACVGLWPYFDDFEQRLKRLHLGLLPGRYRIQAEEAGVKKTELTIDVPAVAPAQPFVIDLR
ncbi:MAG: sigma-70 family RNA polymerase sigma factor [Planctomycetes bacterium]|nr:sigma-70 family RNA polymerase sigma factor [Planctomycetota bacterium]